MSSSDDEEPTKVKVPAAVDANDDDARQQQTLSDEETAQRYADYVCGGNITVILTSNL